MEVDEDDVTVCKQGQGWFVFDVSKLLKLKGQEMHEWFWRLKFKVRNDTKMEVLCNLSFQGVWELVQSYVSLQLTCMELCTCSFCTSMLYKLRTNMFKVSIHPTRHVPCIETMFVNLTSKICQEAKICDIVLLTLSSKKTFSLLMYKSLATKHAHA